MSFFSLVSNLKLIELLGEDRMVFGEIDQQLHIFWLFIESSKEFESKIFNH